MCDSVEMSIREAWEEGHLELGMERLLRAYGPELRGILRSKLRREQAACEAFQMACEGMWKSWSRFQWRSSSLAWARAICHNMAADYLRNPHRRPERNIPLSDAERRAPLVARSRTSTAEYQRTQNKFLLRVLIDRLDERDRTMLQLRVYRRLSWRDVAATLEGDFQSEAELVRVTNRLRKRFQVVTLRLKSQVEAGTSAPGP